MKSILIQKSTQDHIACLLKNLVVHLNLPVSFSSIDAAVLRHPLYPFIPNLNDLLNDWDVRTVLKETTPNELTNMVCPFLVRLKSNNNQYVIVTQANAETVTYIDTQRGLVHSNRYIFEESWNGTIETIEPGTGCGEKNYAKNRSKEKRAKSLRWYLLTVIGIVMLYCYLHGLNANLNPLRWSGIFTLELAGCLIAGTALWKSLKSGNGTGQSHWFSVVPFICFSGSLLFFALSPAEDYNHFTLPVIACLNLSITLFSVYALFKIRSPQVRFNNALITASSILLIPLLLPDIITPKAPTVEPFVLLFLAYNVPIALWFMLRRMFEKQQHLSNQANLLRVYKHPQISKQLLMNAPTMHIPRLTFPISYGPVNANIQLTFFLSLTDETSEKRFLELRQLTSKLSNVRLCIILLSNNSLSEQINRIILAHLSTQSQDSTLELIEQWICDSAKNPNAFSLKHIAQVQPQKLEGIYQEYTSLLNQFNSIKTNTLLINGKLVPGFFDLDDIRFQLFYDPARTNPGTMTVKEKFWKGSRPVYV